MDKDFNRLLRLAGAALVSLALHGLVLSLPMAEKALGKTVQGLAYPVRLLSANLVQAQPLPIPAASQDYQRHRPDPWTPQGEGALETTPTEPSPSSPYLTPSELDERPAIIEFFPLENYALAPNIEGRAVVQLWVNEKGQVDLMEIGESTLPPDLVKHLIASRRDVLFSPGKKNHQTVKSTVRYEINLSKAVSRERQTGAPTEKSE